MRLVVAGLVLAAAAGAQPRSPGPVSATPGRLPGLSSGNIVFPGTPGRSNRGRITSPGLPTPRPPTNVLRPGAPAPAPRPPRPASFEQTPEPRRPRIPRRPVVYVPFYYPVFGYGAPDVIAVSPDHSTRSSARHVITVGGDRNGRQLTTVDRAADFERKPSSDADGGVYYLIALNGGLIYAARTYVVEGGALRFMTLQSEEYVVSLAEVDRAFTLVLNQDRGVEIDLQPH